MDTPDERIAREPAFAWHHILGHQPRRFDVDQSALQGRPNDAVGSGFNQLSTLRDVMVANGDSAKKVWLTEMGAPTGTGSGAVTTTQQATTWQQTFDYRTANSWIGPIFVYDIRDNGTTSSDTEQNFGVVYNNFSHKPAYDVVAAAAGIQQTGGMFFATF